MSPDLIQHLKKCGRRAAAKRYRIAHREQIAAQNARYKREHRDEIRDYNGNYYIEHRDGLRRKRRARQLAKQFAKGQRTIDQKRKKYAWTEEYTARLKTQLKDQLRLAA
jgi:hypothetical protein